MTKSIQFWSRCQSSCRRIRELLQLLLSRSLMDMWMRFVSEFLELDGLMLLSRLDPIRDTFSCLSRASLTFWLPQLVVISLLSLVFAGKWLGHASMLALAQTGWHRSFQECCLSCWEVHSEPNSFGKCSAGCDFCWKVPYLASKVHL